MSWLRFVADLVSSLAWPAVTLLLAFAFRTELRGFAQRLIEILSKQPQKVIAGPVTFEWRDTERAVYPLRQPGKPPKAAEQQTPLSQVARIIPGAAIVQAFVGLEVELREALQASGLADNALTTWAMNRMSQHAARMGLIQKRTLNAINQLNRVRNAAVHTGMDEQQESFGEEKALEYLDMVEITRRAIQRDVEAYISSNG